VSELTLEVDGQFYTLETVVEMVRWAHKHQYWTPEALLEEKGLTAIERVEHFEPVTDLPDCWRIYAGRGYLTQHDYLTLAIPYETGYRCQDEGEFRSMLREKLQAFGDAIMDGWRFIQEQRQK
jgi:hypothetical protein